MKVKLITLTLASLFLTACLDEKAMIQKLTPQDEDLKARRFIELVRTGDYYGAQLMLAFNLQGDQSAKAMWLIHDMLAHDESLEIETVGCNISTHISPTQQTRRTTLSYQLHFKDSWVLSTMVLDQASSGIEIVGYHFYPLKDSLQNINRFTLSGKSPTHFAVLGLCVLIPIFILYALVVCIRSPIRRKWLWIIFILFGLTQFHFNWTTGQASIQPLSIVLLGAGSFSSGLYGPWVLDWGLPVGALVFLLRRRKIIRPPVREMPSRMQT